MNEDDNLNDKMKQLFESLQRVQKKQIEYSLTEGWLYYKIGPSGEKHLAHTTPEMLGVNQVDIFEGLEEVLEEIEALYKEV
jgi:hypothetical protein